MVEKRSEKILPEILGRNQTSAAKASKLHVSVQGLQEAIYLALDKTTLSAFDKNAVMDDIVEHLQRDKSPSR